MKIMKKYLYKADTQENRKFKDTKDQSEVSEKGKSVTLF